ncbi:hypothetical protein KVR01_005926 [Diaporthe batatas]|uniref:uncharacterized protein n=1 Tax=Diaporthe batatas TaxID=748121 RepID=UPI001D037B11|nr:uncharacterized protein KVR01_005926 [Diaporthe batatas]KAG8164008.1 hypothetical protein KVR01_005926 [Diaporthe batatas]
MASTTNSIRPVYVPADSDVGAESIDDYKPGGLHPTHLGDLLGQDGRYKVVHKLGYGGFGTVWLCRDLQQNMWRAVKILAAEHSTGHCADLKICEMLENLSPKERDISFSHVVIPEDHFWLDGPNGTHLCVVMPVLGPNLEDAADRHHHEAQPLKKICYQLVLAMKFLHERGICHGDFRPNNICYVLKGLDDLDEEQILRLLGRPNLLCYVDDDEYDWRSDYAGEAEEDDTFYDEGVAGDDFEDDENVVPSPASEEHEDEHASVNLHEPRYIVIPPNLAISSGYVSDEIAVIDFGESFLASNAPESTGIPHSYCAPEGFFENSYNFGFGSDIWALGCSIFEIRRSGHPFLGFGGVWGLVSEWEDLNGPLPEPYRSAFAKQVEVPEDPLQWATLSVEERKESQAEHMRRVGVPGSLHMLLLLEEQFVVPLAEGEAQPPPPPPGRGCRGRYLMRPGYKIMVSEIPEGEVLELLDLFKKIFAWKPEDRIGVDEILSHAWFNSCREGDVMQMTVSRSESMDLDIDGAEVAEVPDCGIFQYLPAAIRRLLWLNGRGGLW